MSRTFSVLAASGLLMGLLAAAPVAMAANEGNTSGPAVGNTVQPGGAMQKMQNGKMGQSGVNAEAAQGGVAAGAPGVAGQPGNKNGPAPRHTENQSGSTTR